MAVTTLPDPRHTCERIHTNAFTTMALHRCGDCIFSGHTLMLTVACLYWLRLSSVLGVALSLVALLAGVAAIVLNHTHYSVDIVVAVYTAAGVWYSVAYMLARIGWSAEKDRHETLLPCSQKAGAMQPGIVSPPRY